jgi:hypothetical protein
MTTFGVQVYDRSGNGVLLPTGVAFSPTRWSSEAEGGPRMAEVALSGDVNTMLALGNWLGYQVNIASDGGELLWWGQLDALSVTADGLTRELTLDGVANRVKVLYSVRTPGGSLASEETNWAEDAASIASYGLRELVYSASGSLTETQALALQGRLLSALSSPQKKLKIGGAKAGGKLVLRGYWQRLEDVYYAQVAGIEEYVKSGKAIPVGLGFTSAYLAFGGSENAKRIHEVYGKFARFSDYAGLKLVVTGTASNDGVKTVASGDKSEPFDYTSTGVTFDPADDIIDSGAGLEDLSSGDVIWLSGAATGSNNGAKLVKTTGSVHVEISPGWSGGNIVTGAVGPSVNFKRGNSITIEETVTNERPNGSTAETVAAYGQRVYQTFSLTSDATWTVSKIEIRARKVGAPIDSLRLQLVSDNAGVPLAALEIVTVAAADVSGTMDWLTFALSNTVAVTYGTTYGILVDRTGSMDAANFYEVDTVEEGDYSRGALKLFDSATYQPNDGDLIFRLLGAQDTAVQVKQVVEGAGVELGNVLVESNSGIVMLQYQAGDETAQATTAALLEQGAASGERLLCTVTSDRNVRLFVQAPSTERLIVWRGGVLRRAVGGEVAAGWLPVGAWVHIDDLAMSGAWAGLSPVFVERATYQVGSGLSFDAEYQESMAGAIKGVKQG